MIKKLRFFIIIVLLIGVASAAAPNANFYGTPLYGTMPLTVQFYDISTGTPTSWSWDFDNDGTTDSTAQNPNYTYTEIDYHTVRLVVVNIDGSDTETKTNYVYVGGSYPHPTVQPTLRAAFTASEKIGNGYLNVTFTDTSKGLGYFRSWDFGDGNFSANTTSVVTHNYSSIGKYSPTLTIYNSTLTDSCCSYNQIYVYGTVTPLATTTYGLKATQIVAANFNLSAYAEIVPTVYTDLLLQDSTKFFWGFVFLMIFAALFLRYQEIPLLVLFGITVAATFLSLIPSDWANVAQGLLIAGLAAIFYMLIKGKFR